MNTFVDLVYIFVFVFVILSLLIDIRSSLISNKILLFLAVAIFSTLMSVMKSIRRKCPVDTWRSINSGIFTGIFAFVGYTLLWDMYSVKGNKSSREFINDASNNVPGGMNTILAIIVVLSIAFGRAARYIFVADDCEF
jgi:hypothetical protein